MLLWNRFRTCVLGRTVSRSRFSDTPSGVERRAIQGSVAVRPALAVNQMWGSRVMPLGILAVPPRYFRFGV